MHSDRTNRRVQVPPASIASPPTFAWKNGKLFVSNRPLPWGDNDDEGTVRTRAGFRKQPAIELGDDCDSFYVKIYRRVSDSTTPPLWLAALVIANYFHPTWIDNTPDLLDLLKHLAPTVAAMATLSDRTERFAAEAWDRGAEARGRRVWGGR